MLKLEYLIILQKSGMPVYSRCYGDFCASLMGDDTLLSGYLSALSSMPQVFASMGSLSSVEMGSTKLLFNQSISGKFIIVLGFPLSTYDAEEHKHLVKGFFDDMNYVLERKYPNYRWEVISNDQFLAFETDLFINYIQPWFNTTHSSNTCRMGDKCPLRVATMENLGKKGSFWNSLKSTVSSFRQKMGMS